MTELLTRGSLTIFFLRAPRETMLSTFCDNPPRVTVCMRTRVDIYRAKAELCRQTAASLNDVAEKNRWRSLAHQWSEMAEHAKQDRPRDKLIISILRSHAVASGISLIPKTPFQR